MSIRTLLAAWISLVVLGLTTFAAREWFVAPSPLGLDSHPGTAEQPIKVLRNTVQRACAHPLTTPLKDTQECISLAGVTEFEVAPNTVFERREDTNNGGEGIDTKGACRNGTVHHNHVYDLVRLGIYCDAFGSLLENVEIYANTIRTKSQGYLLIDRNLLHGLSLVTGTNAIIAGPRFRVFRGSTEIAANDDWSPAVIGDAFARLGAFPLPASSKDAAALATLDVGQGYSIHISGTGAGTVLVELYDADAAAASTSRLTNVSVRGRAGSADTALSVGLVVADAGERPFLVRGGGPALTAFGVNGVLDDPRLEIFDATRRSLLTNDDWERFSFPAQLEVVRARVGAFAYPGGSRDAAALATLSPGAYTIHVTGAGTPTGGALVEVYESP